MERQFSPVYWDYTAQNPDRAYLADCPTLGQYGEVYGQDYPADWIHLQILALYGSSSSREKGISDGIRLFSTVFSAEVRQYKLSELMLFFSRYKAGKYDNSYTSFDAKRIGNAFFKEFLKERIYEIDKAERARVQKEIDERRFTPPDGYTSFSWYKELQRRASSGDKEAVVQLFGKTIV